MIVYFFLKFKLIIIKILSFELIKQINLNLK